ncbi:unnamed protein product, partial [marine sediment metagenome]
MAEQILDALGVPSLESAFEDSCGMPEELWVDVDAGSTSPLVEDFGQAVRGQSSPVQGEEELTMLGLGTPTQDISSQGCRCSLVEAQELLPSDFSAGHYQVAVFDIHLVELETDKLAGAKSDIEVHQDNGFIPSAGRRVGIDGPYQFPNLVKRKVGWQYVLDTRCRQSFHGAGPDEFLPDEPVEESPQRPEVRIHRDVGQFSRGMVAGRVTLPLLPGPEPTQKIDDCFPLNFYWVRVDAQEIQELTNSHFRVA